jgi:hypothetical protein
MSMINLQEPWWGAGKSYKWYPKITGDMCGFGVDERLVTGDGDLKVVVGKSGKWGVYSIKEAAARDFCLFWDSYRIIKGTKLLVIPKGICEKISYDNDQTSGSPDN